ncbi:hypothetical protein AVEN_176158-1 [Araneus ventricosus]|uniref:Uncharacterized protein n=1 Tax=Araneus ventricosus TaxID=182803 RepID=A0A4Y2Q1A0_ARAVE|nr:hypothetical protein AVEN_176158-1 [Araneus ventricosus]
MIDLHQQRTNSHDSYCDCLALEQRQEKKRAKEIQERLRKEESQRKAKKIKSQLGKRNMFFLLMQLAVKVLPLSSKGIILTIMNKFATNEKKLLKKQHEKTARGPEEIKRERKAIVGKKLKQVETGDMVNLHFLKGE